LPTIATRPDKINKAALDVDFDKLHADAIANVKPFVPSHHLSLYGGIKHTYPGSLVGRASYHAIKP
jgi:hypothetical protein